MQYEVEQKFAVDDFFAVEARLRALAATFRDPIEQSDRYYNHPARDFGQTDEALRIRCVADEARVTYKGPKIDAQTKTRREIELPIGNPGQGQHAAGQFAAMLELLGFRFVAEVRKSRRAAELLWHDAHVEIALDDVAEVGRFVELETSADDAALDAARQTIKSLSSDLGLARQERRSYLEMLLADLPR